MNFKKITAAFLAVITCMSSMSYDSFIKQDDVKENKSAERPSSMANMESTNSLGKLITEKVAAQESGSIENQTPTKDEFTIKAFSFEPEKGIVRLVTTQAAACSVEVKLPCKDLFSY